MKPQFLLFAICSLFFTNGVRAAANYANSAPAIGSQYGLVQNVQNYSSNPFWDPNGPYNQRIAPTPVYLQGADLNTGDCQRTVATLVASYCGMNNNCVGLTLMDVRPNIMLQLSRLPGHNYASACSGFIDTEFSSYVSKYATAAPTNRAVPFPTATVPNTSTDTYEFKIQNPYAPQVPDWLQEMGERKQELQNLQSQNGAGTEKLARADFPLTAADLSFTERMENKRAGYEPFKDASPYANGLLNKWEDEETYRQRQKEKNNLIATGSSSPTATNHASGSITGTNPVKPEELSCEDLASLLQQITQDYNNISNCGQENIANCGTNIAYNASSKNPFEHNVNGTTIVSGDNNSGYNTSLSDSKDCQIDPVTSEKVCCNVTDFANWFRWGSNPIKKNPGDHMFCRVKTSSGTALWAPRMRTCISTSSQDYWSTSCDEEVWCDSSRPDSDALNVKYEPHLGNYCWNWYYMTLNGERTNTKVTWVDIYAPLMKEITDTLQNTQQVFAQKCGKTA